MKNFLILLAFVTTSVQAGILSDVDKQDLVHINQVVNSGFENGKSGWKNTGGTFSVDEDTTGNFYLNFDSTAAAQFVDSKLTVVPEEIYGGKCSVRVNWNEGDNLTEVRVVDQSNVLLATIPLYAVTTNTTRRYKFTCPSSGSWRTRVYSLGDALPVKIAAVYVGEEVENSFVANPIVFNQERSIGSVGSVANARGALVPTDFPIPANAHIYNLDGDANDSTSGTPISLAINGGLQFAGKGFFGRENIADFDGVDDYLSSGNALFHPTSSFSLGGTFTVSKADLNSGSFVYLMNTWPATNRGYILALNGSGGVYFAVSADGTTVGGDVEAVIAEGLNHIAAVYDDTNNLIKIFINGQLAVSEAYASTLFASTASFEVGRRSAGAQYFSGKMEDLFFAQEAYTGSVINGIYSKIFTNHKQIAGGHPLTDDSFPLDDLTGKVSYYNLDDANDDSGNGLTLTNNGGITFDGLDIYGEARIANLKGGGDYLSSSAAFFKAGRVTVGGMFSLNKDDANTAALISRYVTSTANRSYTMFVGVDETLSCIGSVNGTSGTTLTYSGKTINNGEWNHLACSFGLDMIKMYINGILRASKDYSGLYVASTADLEIGSFNNGLNNNEPFKAQDMFVENYVVSDEDIRKLASAKIDLPNAVPSESQDWSATLWKREDSKIENQMKVGFVKDTSPTALYLKTGLNAEDKLILKMRNTGISGTNVSSIRHDTGALSVAPSFPMAHGMGQVPKDVLVMIEGQTTTGDWDYRRDLCSANATNIICDLSGLTIDGTHRVRVVASDLPLGAMLTSASTTTEGLVNTTTQAFGGDKEFAGAIKATGGFDTTGDAGLATDSNDGLSVNLIESGRKKYVLIDAGSKTNCTELGTSLEWCSNDNTTNPIFSEVKPYQDSSGDWWIKFMLSVDQINGIDQDTIAIEGIDSSSFQNISVTCSDSLTAATNLSPGQGFIQGGSNLMHVSCNGVGRRYRSFSGDVRLLSRPTWAN